MPRESTPKTWDELSKLAEGAGEDLVLPPRDIEPDRLLFDGEPFKLTEDD
jgi:hypothetical protein